MKGHPAVATATTTQSMPDMPSIQAYRHAVEIVIAALETNVVRGLITSEAQTRLAHCGKNVLPSAPPPPAMTKPPRDPQSRGINPMMWFDIFFVGSIMMLGTLGVMDWALPRGLLTGGNNGMRYAQTLAFTTLVFF